MSLLVFAAVWVGAWAVWVAMVHALTLGGVAGLLGPAPKDAIRRWRRRESLRMAMRTGALPATVVAFACDVVWTVLS